MSSFEYQHLQRYHFRHGADFDYLVTADFPCFTLAVHLGEITLVVRQYLATLVLPSGISLEILPKVSRFIATQYVQPDKTSPEFISEHHAIIVARQWVRQMLTDIGSQTKQTVLPAFTLGDIRSTNNLSQYLSNQQIANQDSRQSYFDLASVNAPWYQGVLSIAEKKLQAVARYLPTQYQSQLHNQPSGQGKLHLRNQLKYNRHRPHYWYGERHIKTNNTPLAQFLATGWLQLQKILTYQDKDIGSNAQIYRNIMPLPNNQWQSVSNDIERQSTEWQAQLNPVQRQALKEALIWCRWLLLDSIDKLTSTERLSIGQGAPLPAVMINMNHAFEQWVLGHLDSWVAHTLPNSRLVRQPQFDWLTLSAECQARNSSKMASDTAEPINKVVQRITPDACIYAEDNTITHVIDIKYKIINGVNEVAGSDWQQLAVYQQRLQTQQAWLIYPSAALFHQSITVNVNHDSMNMNESSANETKSSNKNTKNSDKTKLTTFSLVPFDTQTRQLL